MECGDNGERNFRDKKHRHDDDQHQGGAVLVIGSLRLLIALVEELLSFLLRQSHRAEQKNI